MRSKAVLISSSGVRKVTYSSSLMRPVHVALDEARQLRAALHAAEGRAAPGASGHEQEGARVDLLAGARHADDDRLAPAARGSCAAPGPWSRRCRCTRRCSRRRRRSSRRSRPRRRRRPGSASRWRRSCRASSNFFGFVSIAMMRSAPAITAPWITESPTPPSPQTATVAPGSTFAVLQHRADPRGHGAAEQAHGLERRVLADLRQRDLRQHRALGEGRGAHVVVHHAALVARAGWCRRASAPCPASRAAPRTGSSCPRGSSLQWRHSGM